jgi:hypothetical protein
MATPGVLFVKGKLLSGPGTSGLRTLAVNLVNYIFLMKPGIAGHLNLYMILSMQGSIRH